MQNFDFLVIVFYSVLLQNLAYLVSTTKGTYVYVV